MSMPGADPPPDPDQLQFERAEFAGGQSGPVCCTCKLPAFPEYHQFQGRIFCTNCRQQIETSIYDLHQRGNLPRAALFGLGAAALGALIFYAVSALTGYEFGLIAVVVGWLVGKAVRKGSGTVGGRKFQFLAMLLTYVSITSTYIPSIARTLAARAEQNPNEVASVGAVKFYLLVAGLSFISPVLAGVENIFGLIIIAIGLWEAWKFNRRIDVKFTGPFSAAAAQ